MSDTTKSCRSGSKRCTTCNRCRQFKFFKSDKARVCTTCQKKRVNSWTRDRRLQETYEISETEYKKMFDAQGGRCAICNGTRSVNLDVDHDHKLAQVGPVRDSIRGLLCRNCNRRLLRAAKDSVAILEAAIEYLKNPPAQKVLNDSIQGQGVEPEIQEVG